MNDLDVKKIIENDISNSSLNDDVKTQLTGLLAELEFAKGVIDIAFAHQAISIYLICLPDTKILDSETFLYWHSNLNKFNSKVSVV